jgi:putative ABC transport system ATP-binding protein
MEPILSAEALAKTYAAGDSPGHALRGVDLALERGRFAAVVGPSGCGKSTLLFCLGLMMRPTSGRIRLEGRDVADLSDSARTAVRRQRIGFVFQRFNLVPVLSALDNVLLPLRIAGRRDAGEARGLLAAVGLEGKLSRKPHQLSIGEQQRVAIARAMVQNPAILLADEPTGNLDSETGERILELLRSFHRQRGLTILMITHNPAAAQAAEQVFAMRDGRMTPSGPRPAA